MRPENLKTKIFLDGGDPAETQEIIALLGFLDGQTTNPSLVAKNPQAQERISRGDKFSSQELLDFYKIVVSDTSALIPNGSISIEVYADMETRADAMLVQARQMNTWIPNAHIKFPTTLEGLEAAAQAVREGMRVNMTLCFTQKQAAAVHLATLGCREGQVLVSPFVGRLDDIGENGMDLIKNIRAMYQEIQSPVQILTASVRSMDHFFSALALESDIITAPANMLREWARQGMQVPDVEFTYAASGLKPIPFIPLTLTGGWRSLDISHPLTNKGIEKFAHDWNALLK